MPLRVVFAEDNYLVREGTAALLAEVEEIDLVRLVEDPNSLMKAVAEEKPDAVMTDIRMPPTHTTEGIDAAKRIRAEYPGIGVLVLSQYVEEDYAFELLQDGVAGLGYCSRSASRRSTTSSARSTTCAAAGSALDPLVVEGLLERRTREAKSPLAGLNDRERDVLREMATGKNNAAIGRSLYLSERAIEKHINSLFHKLGISDEPDMNRRVMAVLAFLQADPAR
jgi:DNA-binding NarL/FixJ family response regulator